MKRFFPVHVFLVCGLWLGGWTWAAASPTYVTSPDHAQTFAFGSEQNRAWTTQGRHLALVLNFTNEPYVDSINPRCYDNFIFNFPRVTLGSDDRTFYYRTGEGRSIPVAVKQPGFLGMDEIRLLPGSRLMVEKPHGYLTAVLAVGGLVELGSS